MIQFVEYSQLRGIQLLGIVLCTNCIIGHHSGSQLTTSVFSIHYITPHNDIPRQQILTLDILCSSLYYFMIQKLI